MKPSLELVDERRQANQSSEGNTIPSAKLQEKDIAILLEQAKAGDVKAFKALYEDHINMVYGLCFRLCADKSQAADASQEVFIQVWKSLSNFKAQSKFSTWLHALASKVCISYIRTQKNWWLRAFSIVDSEEAKVLEEQNDAGECNLEALEALIFKLPERMRHVFVLHAIEGYRHEQLAAMLGVSVNTSKVQFHRARKQIEEWVNE